MGYNVEHKVMATIQTTLRFEDWIHDEIKRVADDRGVSFASIVNLLLESELNRMGHTAAEWRKRKLGLEDIDELTGERRAQ